MIQWISGQLEASYVGEPSKLVLPRTDKNQRRYQLRVFRAAVREVRPIAAPADARPPVIDPPSELPQAPVGEPFAQVAAFRQARIDDAHVTDLRGSGSYFLGALFDVRVSAVELSFPTDKSGRAYGRMTGTVVACVVLPPEPQPERVPESVLILEPAPPAAKGELHVPTQAQSDEATLAPIEEPLPARTREASPLLPSLAASAVVCLALALQCGALPAVLWALFMLPTLVARRMLSGVLPDSRGMNIVGAASILVQLVCTVVLVQSWWSADCRALSIWPLLGVVAMLFPSGVLPSPLPLLCNAVCLASILFGWCTGTTECEVAPSASSAPQHSE